LATGFLAGGYAGFEFGIRFRQRFDEVALETRLMVDAKTRLSALTSLRNSHQDNAILLLENLLDGDIIGINSFLETSSRRTELIEILSRVAKYRAQTNYRSTRAEVASAVQEALEHAGQPNSAVKRDAP
jgi:hypothetical protein